MTPSSAASARPASSRPPRRSCASIPTPLPTKSAGAWAGISAGAAPTPACCWPWPMPPKPKEALNMIKIDWPAAEKRSLIGKRIDRLDGPAKSTGAAKYSYDINPPGLLWAKLVTSPHPKADIVSIDLSAAAALPGVKATWKNELKETQYVGQIVAAVAAESEEIATEAAELVKVEYKPTEH